MIDPSIAISLPAGKDRISLLSISDFLAKRPHVNRGSAIVQMVLIAAIYSGKVGYTLAGVSKSFAGAQKMALQPAGNTGRTAFPMPLKLPSSRRPSCKIPDDGAAGRSAPSIN